MNPLKTFLLSIALLSLLALPLTFAITPPTNGIVKNAIVVTCPGPYCGGSSGNSITYTANAPISISGNTIGISIGQGLGINSANQLINTGNGGSTLYYFTPTPSTFTGVNTMTLLPYNTKTAIVSNTLHAGSNLVFSFVTTAAAGLSYIPFGSYECHMHLAETSGTDPTSLYCTVIEFASNGAEIQPIGSTESTPALTSNELEYREYFADPNTYNIASNSLLEVQVYADVVTGGSLPQVTIWAGGEADSHLAIPGSGGAGNVNLGLPFNSLQYNNQGVLGGSSDSFTSNGYVTTINGNGIYEVPAPTVAVNYGEGDGSYNNNNGDYWGATIYPYYSVAGVIHYGAGRYVCTTDNANGDYSSIGLDYSWTPVFGAQGYKLIIDTNNDANCGGNADGYSDDSSLSGVYGLYTHTNSYADGSASDWTNNITITPTTTFLGVANVGENLFAWQNANVIENLTVGENLTVVGASTLTQAVTAEQGLTIPLATGYIHLNVQGDLFSILDSGNAAFLHFSGSEAGLYMTGNKGCVYNIWTGLGAGTDANSLSFDGCTPSTHLEILNKTQIKFPTGNVVVQNSLSSNGLIEGGHAGLTKVINSYNGIATCTISTYNGIIYATTC